MARPAHTSTRIVAAAACAAILFAAVAFTPRHALDEARLVELFAWSEEEFLLRTEGSAIRRIGYECWLRNIAVALGNAPTSEAVVQALAARREHPSALVREHVDWALEQHRKMSG